MRKKNLTKDGFPVREHLGPILGPLIREYHAEIRERLYPPEVVVFAMVTGILARDKTLFSAVIRSNADRIQQGLEVGSMNTAAISDARSRLHPEVLKKASCELASLITKHIPADSFWEGFVPYAIDGSTVTATDTLANQAEFPQHGSQQAGSGYPLIRLVVLQSLMSGCIHRLEYGAFQGKDTGEMSLARRALQDLDENALLIGDRYFPSYFTMADLIQKNVNGLFQTHASRHVDFRRGIQNGVLDHLVDWDKPPRPSWMSLEVYSQYPDHIRLREVDVTRETGTGEKMVIVTTLLDSKKYSKKKLSKFYIKRWKIELALRDLKDTFNMAHIEAKTPDMVEKVLWSHILAYNSLRWHMANAAILYETKIEKISVKTAARLVTENQSSILNSTENERPALFAALYAQMVTVPVGNRDGRSEPRAVKRRPKPYARLRGKRSDYRRK